MEQFLEAECYFRYSHRVKYIPRDNTSN